MGAPSDLLINKLIDLFEIAKRLQIFFHAAGQFLLHDSERGQEVGVSMRALREDHATLLVELQEVADMLPPPEELSNHYYTSLSQIFTYKAKGINKGWGVKSTAEEMDTGVLTDGIKLFTTGKVIYFDGTKLFRRDTTERQILQFSETAAAAKLVAGAIVRSIWKCIGQDVQHRVPTKLHHIKDKLRAEGGTEVVASFDENHIAHGERGGNLDDHAEARLLSQTDSRKYGPILYVSDPPCCHWYYVLHVPAVVRGEKVELQFLAPGQEVKELSEAAIIKAAMTNGRLCQITKNRDRQKIQTLFPEPEVIVRKTREIETREKRLTFVLPEGKGNKQHVARDEYEFLPGNPRQAEIRAALGPYGIAELGVARFSRMIRGCVVSIKHAGVHEVQCYATDTTKGSEAALFNYCSMNGINLRFLKKRDFA